MVFCCFMSIISFGWLCRKFCSRKKPMQHPHRLVLVRLQHHGRVWKPWKHGGTKPCLDTSASNPIKGIGHQQPQQLGMHSTPLSLPTKRLPWKTPMATQTHAHPQVLAITTESLWSASFGSFDSSLDQQAGQCKRLIYRNCLHEQTTQNLSSQNFFIKRGSMKFDVNVTACDGKGARYRSESTLTKANHVATTPWYQMVPCSKHLEPSSCGTRLVLMDHSGSRAKNRKLTQSKSHATLIAIRWRVWKLVLRKKLVCRYI